MPTNMTSTPRASSRHSSTSLVQAVSSLQINPIALSNTPSKSITANVQSKDDKPVPKLGGISRLIKQYGAGTAIYGIAGTIAAIANGALLPIWVQFFGDLMQSGIDPTVDHAKEAVRFLTIFMIIGVAYLVFYVPQYVCWGIYGAKISAEARKRCFQDLLRQDIGYYDKKNSGAINTELISNCLNIAGMGTAIGLVQQNFVTFIGGFVVAFLYVFYVLFLSTVSILCFCPLYVSSVCIDVL